MNLTFAKGLYWRFEAALPGSAHKYAEHAFLNLVHQYTERGRFYHNIFHVEEVLNALEGIAKNDGSLEPTTVLAAFYHDVVYRPEASKGASEAMSKADFDGMWQGRLPDAMVKEVGSLILTTADYASFGSKNLLGDCDLAILGSARPQYEKYILRLREEYGVFSEDQWKQGRSAFLKTMLDLPRIFSTDAAYRAWEDRSKSNMQAELDVLSAVFNRAL